MYLVPLCCVLAACGRSPRDIVDCIKGVDRPTALEDAIKQVKAAGFSVVPVSAAAAAGHQANPPPKGQVDLLCEAVVDGKRSTTVVQLDLRSHTANGLPADMTRSEVTWTSTSHDPVTGRPALKRHSLNRLNGDYRSYEDGAIYAAPPPTYHCAQTVAQRF